MEIWFVTNLFAILSLIFFCLNWEKKKLCNGYIPFPLHDLRQCIRNAAFHGRKYNSTAHWNVPKIAVITFTFSICRVVNIFSLLLMCKIWLNLCQYCITLADLEPRQKHNQRRGKQKLTTGVFFLVCGCRFSRLWGWGWLDLEWDVWWRQILPEALSLF